MALFFFFSFFFFFLFLFSPAVAFADVVPGRAMLGQKSHALPCVALSCLALPLEFAAAQVYKVQTFASALNDRLRLPVSPC